MNFYQFLKSIQEGVGDGCSISIRLWDFDNVINGLSISIDWPNDFHYIFAVLEKMLENYGLLEHLSEYIIHDANKRFKIAEVGEE